MCFLMGTQIGITSLVKCLIVYPLKVIMLLYIICNLKFYFGGNGV
jgi:hypothetical protein